MFPKTLYLQKEFCGLEPGTPFALEARTGVGGECYHHGSFIVPAEEAHENEEWFATTRPRAARAGGGSGEHEDEDG